MADTQETIANIIAEMETERPGLMNAPMNTNNLYYARRLKAAHKREREAITPKSNPDWKDICAKCKDGDIEPNYCEYYEEPNGCNSPIYGEHPTAKKSLVVGDCAKLREAASYLTSIFSCDIQFLERHAKELRDTGAYGGGIIEHILHSITLARAALAAQPRNCDRFGSSTQARAEWYKTEVLPRVEGVVSGVEPPFVDWLFAPATENEGDNDADK